MKVTLIYIINAVAILILFSGCFGFHNFYHDDNYEDHPSRHHR